MMIFDTNTARKLLNEAGVFFDIDYDDKFRDDQSAQTLNMNDVWGWAVSDGEFVPDEKLSEVAELFYWYGWAGILYWVSKQRGSCHSEFYDNNRFIEFVGHEEQLKKEMPNSSERAYKKVTYTLGLR